MDSESYKKLIENYESLVANLQKIEKQHNALISAMEEWLDDEMLEKIASTVNAHNGLDKC